VWWDGILRGRSGSYFFRGRLIERRSRSYLKGIDVRRDEVINWENDEKPRHPHLIGYPTKPSAVLPY
jgi:hypothetical protein